MVPGATVSLNEQVMTPHLSALRVLLLFIVPLLTMRTIAGEREQKTLPLLLVSPVSVFSIVFGKFTVLSLLLAIFIAVQSYFGFALYSVATLEILPVVVGLFGVYLLANLYLAIGIAVSSFCGSQIVAGSVSFLLLFLLHSVEALVPEFGGNLTEIIRMISPNLRLEGLVQGLLKSSDLIFFAGLTVAFLLMAQERLALERGR
jgi:ABC-2 type transport system permease protein